MNEKQYEEYIKRTDIRRKNVVMEVEEACHGGSERILPALFFVPMKELTPKSILSLDVAIDMFWCGYESGLCKRD